MLEAIATGATARPVKAAPEDPAALTRTAFWGLTVLVAFSLCARPLASWSGASQGVVNLDSVLTPLVAAALVCLTMALRRSVDQLVRWACGTVCLLSLVTVVSWAVNSPHSLASLALAFASVILLPLALLIAVVASREPGSVQVGSTLLRVLVLLQLVFGVVQYVDHRVAQNAPWRADLVNGTTSHNLWPAAALPMSILLAVLERRGATRWLWPASIAILGVYAEAKAALLLWLPVLAVVVALELARALPGLRAARRGRRTGSRSWYDRFASMASASVALATAVVVAIGLWWSPSVLGTWHVLQGHTRDAEAFAHQNGPTPSGGTPTYHDAVSRLAAVIPGSARSLMLGLGPGNSVSHAAEIMARGTAAGVTLPKPGPLAVALLGNEGPLQFEDAQSSLLGLYGDLGVIGCVAFAASLVVLLAGLLRMRGLPSLDEAPLVLLVLALTLGPLATGLLLDWQEQASIVLPLALTQAVAARALWVGRGRGLPDPQGRHAALL